MTDRRVRIAVVGAGAAAQLVHLPILARLRSVELVGLVDVRSRTARSVADRFGIPATASVLDELDGRHELDAVLICTPNATHEAGVLAALGLGCHVLCERPLAPTGPAADRMTAAAKEAGRHLVVANNHRYRFDFRAIRHAVDEGRLGRITYVRSTWLNRRGSRPRQGWRRDTVAGGGVLLDLGAQALDLALWAVGEPEVTGVVARLRRDRDGGETGAFVQLGLAGGGTATVEASWELVHERDVQRLFVLGENGSADSAPFQIRTASGMGATDITPQFTRRAAELYRDSYRQEWATFIRTVRGDGQPEGPDDQARLLRIVDACRASAENGGEVRP